MSSMARKRESVIITSSLLITCRVIKVGQWSRRSFPPIGALFPCGKSSHTGRKPLRGAWYVSPCQLARPEHIWWYHKALKEEDVSVSLLRSALQQHPFRWCYIR